MNISNNIKRIPANQIWDLKNSISEFILPRLELSIKKVESDEFLAIPIWVQDEASNEAMTDVEMKQRWVQILKQMIFPFEFNLYPEKYMHLSYNEITSGITNGLEMFSKYFQHLWD